MSCLLEVISFCFLRYGLLEEETGTNPDPTSHRSSNSNDALHAFSYPRRTAVLLSSDGFHARPTPESCPDARSCRPRFGGEGAWGPSTSSFPLLTGLAGDGLHCYLSQW